MSVPKLATAEERDFRDGIADEYLEMQGTLVSFLSINKTLSVSNVLYGEPADLEDWETQEFAEVPVFINKPDSDIQNTEGGKTTTKSGECSFARGYFRRNSIPSPKEGDLIVHSSWGTYEIKQASADGFYSEDADDFTVYICQIERFSKNLPERKTMIDNQMIGL